MHANNSLAGIRDSHSQAVHEMYARQSAFIRGSKFALNITPFFEN